MLAPNHRRAVIEKDGPVRVVVEVAVLDAALFLNLVRVDPARARDVLTAEVDVAHPAVEHDARPFAESHHVGASREGARYGVQLRREAILAHEPAPVRNLDLRARQIGALRHVDHAALAVVCGCRQRSRDRRVAVVRAGRVCAVGEDAVGG